MAAGLQHKPPPTSVTLPEAPYCAYLSLKRCDNATVAVTMAAEGGPNHKDEGAPPANCQWLGGVFEFAPVRLRLRLAIAVDHFWSKSVFSATLSLGGDDKPSRTDSESQAQTVQSHTLLKMSVGSVSYLGVDSRSTVTE